MPVSAVSLVCWVCLYDIGGSADEIGVVVREG